METLKFKTNIKCGGCIATVTPFLNKLETIENWEVDTTSPDKILTIKGIHNLDSKAVVQALENAGYKAEQL